jgi:putative membrane protein
MACCLLLAGKWVTKNIDMKHMIFVCCAFVSSMVISSCGGSNSTDNAKDTSAAAASADTLKTPAKVLKSVDKDASDFAMMAASGGMMEVQLGKLAQEKALSQRVKDFGSMMVTDHSKAGDDLKSRVSGLTLTLPDSLSSGDKKEIDKLSQKKGKEFDKAYMNRMLEDHKKDISEFRKAADKLSDSTLKDFAASTLPVLEKHLDSAKAISGKH